MNLILKVSDKFTDYLTKKEYFFGGIHYVYMFPNGYGASIVKHLGSYGKELDLWELAVVVECSDGTYHLVYDTPITDDVIGYLTDDQVDGLLYLIMELRKEKENGNV